MMAQSEHREAALFPAEEPSQKTGVEPVLCTTDLCAGYGKKEVLHGISIEVRVGEIVALIGPNGAGKSTLLKAVAGLLRPSAGRILFNRRDISAIPVHRRVREGIAYIMQGGAIFPSLTAQEHLVLGSRAARDRRNGASQGFATDLLPKSLAAKREPAGLFSGGQRQALAVAAVLAGEPALLLCDEPSAGLAPAAANDLLKRIAKLSRERSLPVLWVEQRVADVLAVADRAILLRDGKVAAETSKPQEWLSTDVLATLTFGISAREEGE